MKPLSHHFKLSSKTLPPPESTPSQKDSYGLILCFQNIAFTMFGATEFTQMNNSSDFLSGNYKQGLSLYFGSFPKGAKSQHKICGREMIVQLTSLHLKRDFFYI